MNNLELKDVFTRRNGDVNEYMDIFFETNIGFLKYNVTTLDFADCGNIEEVTRVTEIDRLKDIYGTLYIREARKTYDNNMYLLISDKAILAIEYVLNSTFAYSVQEIRIIEDIFGVNKWELDEYKELEIVKLPG